MKSKLLYLFESEKIKKYIDDNYERLSTEQINNIICCSLASLEKKLLFLSELRKLDKTYNNTYESINNALSLLVLKENEIFILKGQGIDKENIADKNIKVKAYEYVPFDNYEKAIKYIKTTCQELFKHNEFEKMSIWFVLEKWTLDDSGMYEKVISYYISLYGDIWLYQFDYGYVLKQEKQNSDLSLLENIDIYADLNELEIPTPYKFGDIFSWIKKVFENSTHIS